MHKTRSRGALLTVFAAIAIANASVGAPPSETDNLISQLIRQLGHEDYAAREAASQELVEIGEPALPALQNAATTRTDPEVRWRAQQVVQTVMERIRAAAMKKALEELQGTWTLVYSETGGKQTGGEVKSYVFSFQGAKWSIHAGGQLSQGGTVMSIEVKEKLNAIDLAITEGANTGVTAISIYAVEGDTLKYINSGEPRATEFVTKPGDGRGYQIFRRASAEP